MAREVLELPSTRIDPTASWLLSWQHHLVESWALTPGTAVLVEDTVHLHPLDLIALIHGDDIDGRMAAAMELILGVLDRKLAALTALLDAAMEAR